VALSGLGIIVVKALGGEEVTLAQGTVLTLEENAQLETTVDGTHEHATVPPGTKITYPNGSEVTRSEAFKITKSKSDVPLAATDGRLTLPAGVKQAVPGSSWGAFTIACTVPIAFLVGLYMYKLRKGRVVEASLIGALATIGVTVLGNWIPGSPLEGIFSLSREQVIIAICTYGFIASVLPVWLLLCPRDYLSSFLKIGTIILLVVSTIVANPPMRAETINEHFSSGGPIFSGAIFPFCFICIMCGAISGFHSLVSSGTTPKMISKESHVRPIGYGAMLMEGLVGIVALIAAASLPAGDYYAINFPLSAPPGREAEYAGYQEKLRLMGADTDNLAVIEQQVGGESLRGRTGGAVTLAVGMSSVITEATRRVSGDAIHVDGLVKYWYHFAIMFEALFILTTIDTGTRIARFLLQETLGKIWKPFERTDWVPGAVISTAIVTFGWGALIWGGSIDTIWPMFGIANQLLAVIALTVVTTWIVNSGRGKYAFLTIAPMLFVISSTMTAGYQMIRGPFYSALETGLTKSDYALIAKGGLNIALTLFMMIAVSIILLQALGRWINHARQAKLRS
jgi:carbon starvation protein